MNTFPIISTGPKIEDFTDEFTDAAVTVANPAMGYLSVIENFTFDGQNFSYTLRRVSQADKLTIETFYQANKDVHFNWLNEQDDATYEVVFAHKPHCQLDGANDRWKIDLSFLQAGV